MGQREFTTDELERYSRHFVLPGVGVEGQHKLKAASVLIVGAGGLGSPVGLYLAGAGVGRIGIVDHDTVSISNLQRQVLYRSDDVGKRKSDVARERLHATNPTIEVGSHFERLNASNALELMKDYEIIADCTDNFPTRYLINDSCVFQKKINAYGSVFRFEGQVSVFDSRIGPCYRCVYPAPPPAELVQDCAQAGVLGVLPGIVGALQANEIIKVILGKGTTLVGRLFLIDALATKTKEIVVRKDPKCPVCGEHPSIQSLIDYEEFCSGVSDCAGGSERKEESEISAMELKRRLDSREPIDLLDVREPHEYAICNLGGKLIPLRELDRRKIELNEGHEFIVYCHHGIRSHVAMTLLKQSGFRNVKNLVGGIDAWAREVDGTMPRY